MDANGYGFHPLAKHSPVKQTQSALDAKALARRIHKVDGQPDMTGLLGMLPSNHFNYDARDAMDMGETIPPSKPAPRRRTEEHVKRIEDYPFWVAMVWKDGRPHLRSSSEMRQYKNMVLRPEAEKKFQHVMTNYIGGPPKQQEGGKLLANTLPSSVDEQTMAFSRKATKRRHTGIVETVDQRPFFLPDPKVEARLPGRGERKVPLLVKDWDAQQKWFGEAFKAVQQVGCRTIAKVWIKKIHPKKQSTHPYNGGMPREALPDANRTRPPYWPQGVIHKEPDHIDRNARTSLLVHLIMHTPQQQLKTSSDDGTLIYATDLLQALEEKKGDFKEDRWAIIQEIISVREQLERFNDSSEYCDPSTVIHVSDFSEPARSKNEADADIDDDEREDVVDDDQQISNSTSSGTTTVPSPDEPPPRHLHQQRLRNEQDVKTMSADQRPLEHLADLDNDVRLATPQSDYEMPHAFTNGFLTMTANQSQPAMTVNNVPYSHKPVPGMNARLGRPTARPTMAFHPPMNPRHAQDIGIPDWMANGAPTEMLPMDYSFNGMQCQTQVSNQSFRMNEAAMASNGREMMGAGLLVESMPYQSFPDHSKPLQHRAMSASHAAMLESPIHDGHMFYPG